MSRDVRFSFDTDVQKAEFEAYARAKGMSLSALSKMALFQYKAKYAIHGDGPIRKPGRPRKEIMPVQSLISSGNGMEAVPSKAT